MLRRQAAARLSALHQPHGPVNTGARYYASKKAPTLADITPESPESFNKAQVEFRERLRSEAEDKKRQELEESMSAASASEETSTTTTTTTPPSLIGATLSSLTSKFADEARAREDAASGKKAGALTSLIYGTPEGREMDREIERSFSEVLARGKYVHSIVTHQVKPDKVDEYVDLVGDWYPKMANSPDMRVKLVGSWRTEIGDSDTFGTFWRCIAFLTVHSSHLGVPQVQRLPRIATCYSEASRIHFF
jgi:hypothetical protein